MLLNSFLEFKEKVKQQVAGTAIGTNFAPSYACIYMDEAETKFLKTKELQLLVWFRYIDDIFFIWKHSAGELTKATLIYV